MPRSSSFARDRHNLRFPEKQQHFWQKLRQIESIETLSNISSTTSMVAYEALIEPENSSHTWRHGPKSWVHNQRLHDLKLQNWISTCVPINKWPQLYFHIRPKSEGEDWKIFVLWPNTVAEYWNFLKLLSISLFCSLILNFDNAFLMKPYQNLNETKLILRDLGKFKYLPN